MCEKNSKNPNLIRRAANLSCANAGGTSTVVHPPARRGVGVEIHPIAYGDVRNSMRRIPLDRKSEKRKKERGRERGEREKESEKERERKNEIKI